MSAATVSPHWPKLPEPLRAFFTNFPIVTYPPNVSPINSNPEVPTIWAFPPTDDTLLSSDVESLCWQAYLALRGGKRVLVRFDVSEAGAIGGYLPNLHVPAAEGESIGQLLPAEDIPQWVNSQSGSQDELEGYINAAAKDESKAWVSLLKGTIYTLLVLATSTKESLISIIENTPKPRRSWNMSISPPSAPLFGFGSLFYTKQTRVSKALTDSQYQMAIASLSERLGSDMWFLGSKSPTYLDALAFAYLHLILAGPYPISHVVIKRANLVDWEKRVSSIVSGVLEHAT